MVRINGFDLNLINKLQRMKLNSYKWERTEYNKLLWKSRINIIPSFENVFDSFKNITKPTLKEIYKRINGETPDHAIITCRGQTGSGKSLSMISLNKLMFGDDFNADNIVFTNNDILKKCESIKPKQMIQQDEEPESVGMGSYRESIEIKNIEETTRKKRISLTFCCPTERIHQTAHFHLEVIEKCLKPRVNHIAVYDKITEQYLGYIILPILKDSDPIIKEYTIKKDEFIEKILKRQSNRIDLDEALEKIKRHPDISKVTKKSHILVLVKSIFPTLTTQEQKTIADYYDMQNQDSKLLCEKCKKKSLRKYKDTFKCWICGWVME